MENTATTSCSIVKRRTSEGNLCKVYAFYTDIKDCESVITFIQYVLRPAHFPIDEELNFKPVRRYKERILYRLVFAMRTVTFHTIMGGLKQAMDHFEKHGKTTSVKTLLSEVDAS
jgi:hypothetical protein